MPKNTPCPVPTKGAILKWAMDNEDALIALVQFINKLNALELNIVTAGGYNTAKKALVEGSDNLVLPIPLKLGAPIANATNAATAITQQNLLYAALRVTGQLPA